MERRNTVGQDDDTQVHDQEGAGEKDHRAQVDGEEDLPLVEDEVAADRRRLPAL
jgi:hypothetical protein